LDKTSKDIIEPPGPKHKFLGANAYFSFLTDGLSFLTKLHKEYGDIVMLKASGHRIYLIADLKYIDHILVRDPENFTKGVGFQRGRIILGNGILTSEGPFHHSQRKMINPAFHRSRWEMYFDVVKKCVEELIVDWNSRIKKNNVLELHEEMMNLFVEIIFTTVFSEDKNETLCDYAKEFGDLFHKLNPIYLLDPHFALKLPFPSINRIKRAKENLDKEIFKVIDKRQKENIKRDDILGIMLDARDEDGKPMSREQLYDEIFTIYMAGTDTSAKVMTWGFYLLEQNKNDFEKFLKEVDEVIGKRDIEFEDFEKLTFTRLVLNETMRMYPPVWLLPRTAEKDFYLDDYLIHKDSSIFITPYLLQRNPKYFENPEMFDPERFNAERKKSIKKFSFIPFGAGPRVCIGEGFAMLHGAVILSLISREFKMTLKKGHKIKLSSSLTLRPKYGVKMVVEPK
jgi:cytochrome P450